MIDRWRLLVPVVVALLAGFWMGRGTSPGAFGETRYAHGNETALSTTPPSPDDPQTLWIRVPVLEWVATANDAALQIEQMKRDLAVAVRTTAGFLERTSTEHPLHPWGYVLLRELHHPDAAKALLRGVNDPGRNPKNGVPFQLRVMMMPPFPAFETALEFSRPLVTRQQIVAWIGHRDQSPSPFVNPQVNENEQRVGPERDLWLVHLLVKLDGPAEARQQLLQAADSIPAAPQSEILRRLAERVEELRQPPSTKGL